MILILLSIREISLNNTGIITALAACSVAKNRQREVLALCNCCIQELTSRIEWKQRATAISTAVMKDTCLVATAFTVNVAASVSKLLPVLPFCIRLYYF